MKNSRPLQMFLRSDKTVLSFKEMLLASGDKNPALLRRRVNYYVHKKELYPIRRGFYGKDQYYKKHEFATKIYTPAYISFETILLEAGIIFQHYTTLFIASYKTKDICCDGQNYSFRKIKERALTNPAGVENKGNYFAASKERAFLDTLYLNKNYHFDNLTPLNLDKLIKILPIYENKNLTKRALAFFTTDTKI